MLTVVVILFVSRRLVCLLSEPLGARHPPLCEEQAPSKKVAGWAWSWLEIADTLAAMMGWVGVVQAWHWRRQDSRDSGQFMFLLPAMAYRHCLSRHVHRFPWLIVFICFTDQSGTLYTKPCSLLYIQLSPVVICIEFDYRVYMVSRCIMSNKISHAGSRTHAYISVSSRND